MAAVKPETDEEHLRLRARWSVWLKRGQNLPVRKSDLARLVIKGGKDARKAA